jgi:hypothetical protein
MKSIRLNSFAILMALTLIFLAVATSYTAGAEAKLNKNELKTLLKSAKTPADHQRLAAYYRWEAQRLVASSKEHSKQAAAYEETQPFAALELKHGSAFGQGASHCRYFAQLESQSAKIAEAEAARHEEMAKRAEAVTATYQPPTR